LKGKTEEGFRQLRTRIFLRTAAMMILAAAAVYLIYSFLLRGHFASFMIALIQAAPGMDYDAAFALYQRVFRSHMDTIIILSLLLVFLALFRIHLRWLTGYFEEVSRGLDALYQDEAISLPSELFSIERRLNLTKQMIDRQRNDMRLAEQRKNDLVMYLAHDLKTPLASAISYLNLLRDEGQISEELRERYLLIAITKAERLEELINEFLEIAKYNLSSITLQYREINLTRLMEQLIY